MKAVKSDFDYYPGYNIVRQYGQHTKNGLGKIYL